MAAIIFDMDGTIADSFDFVVDYVAGRAHKYPLSENERQALRGHSMAGIARELGVPWWKMLGLFYGGRRSMGGSMHRVVPFKDMPEIIGKLHNEGHELFLVSSNSVRNVRRFLRQHHMQQYFLEVYGGTGFFSKTPTLRKLSQEQQIPITNCIYIGDELRDVQASRAANMRVVAVTWGFARTEALQAEKPNFMVDTPQELLEILETI